MDDDSVLAMLAHPDVQALTKDGKLTSKMQALLDSQKDAIEFISNPEVQGKRFSLLKYLIGQQPTPSGYRWAVNPQKSYESHLVKDGKK